MIYYIGDTHIGHANVIMHDEKNGCKHFENINEHDDLIINNWNSIVTNDDDVYIVGDFSWLNATLTLDILKKLPGRKHLIIGNHDKWFKKDNKEIIKQFIDIHETSLINDNGRHVFLSHYPVAMWNGQHRDYIHLYAHVHDTPEEADFQEIVRELEHKYSIRSGYDVHLRAYNVGCMKWNYKPVTLDEILGVNR